MNMIRNILSNEATPKIFFLSKAANWSNYVLNRSPTIGVKEATLEEK